MRHLIVLLLSASALFGQININRAVFEYEVTPGQFGAKGDGTTDDTESLYRAFKHISTKKGSIRIPAGKTFIVNPASRKLLVKSNVRVIGGGTIKVKASSGNYDYIFSSDSPSDAVDNVVFEDITVDQNTANNTTATISVADSSTHQMVMKYFNITNLTVRGVTIKASGVNTIDANGANVDNIVLVNNKITFQKRSGQANFDNSCFYVSAKRATVTGNIFQATSSDNATTAIEWHLATGTIANNTTDWYIGMIVVDGQNVVVSGNTLKNCSSCISLWALTGVTTSNLNIIGNNININQLTRAVTAWFGIGMYRDSLSETVNGDYNGLNISHNVIRTEKETVARSVQGYDSYGIGLTPRGDVRNVSVRHNVLINPSMRGIKIGNEADAVANNTQFVQVESNTIVDPGTNPDSTAQNYSAGIAVGGNCRDCYIRNNFIRSTDNPIRGHYDFYINPGTARTFARTVLANNNVTTDAGAYSTSLDASVVQDKFVYGGDVLTTANTIPTVSSTSGKLQQNTGLVYKAGNLGVNAGTDPTSTVTVGGDIDVIGTSSIGDVTLSNVPGSTGVRKFQAKIAGGGDFLQIGTSGSAYAGAILWMPSSAAYTYVPDTTTYRLGFGTTAGQYFEFKKNAFSLGSTIALDFSGAASTKPTKQGSVDPVTCSVSELFWNTASAKYRVCSSTNTWTDLAGAGGGGGVTSVTGSSPISSSGGTTPDISCSTCVTLAGTQNLSNKTFTDAVQFNSTITADSTITGKLNLDMINTPPSTGTKALSLRTAGSDVFQHGTSGSSYAGALLWLPSSSAFTYLPDTYTYRIGFGTATNQYVEFTKSSLSTGGAIGVNHNGAASTRPTKSGTADPGSCSVSELFYNTTSNKLKVCTASNTWTDYSPGGGSVTSVTASSPIASSGGSTPDISCSTCVTTAGTQTLTNKTLTSPTLNTPLTTNGTITQAANGDDALVVKRQTDTSPTGTLLRLRNAAASSDLWVVDVTGTLTAGTVGAARLSGTLAAAQFPALTGDITTSAGSLATTLATSGVTAATYGASGKIHQITVDAKGRVTAASERTMAKADMLGTTVFNDQANTWTAGAQDFSGAASTKPTKSGSADPGTCSVSEMFYNTTSNKLKVCTATNTWSDYSPGSGSVSSVTATSPIASSGGSTPDISCSTCVTTAGTQTLTNKTLTSPTVNTPSVTNATITQAANGNDAVVIKRQTDSSPTGNLLRLRNAAGNSDLWVVDVTGTLTVGTVGAARLSGTLAAAQFPALTGDITTSAGNLATTLAASGVTANTYGATGKVHQITVDSKGRVTAASERTELAVDSRTIYSAFLPGSSASTYNFGNITIDKAITVTRLQTVAKTPPVGCVTNAQLRLTDGNVANQRVLDITAAQNDSGAISQNYTAGSILTLSIPVNPVGCSTVAADIGAFVQYKLQ